MNTINKIGGCVPPVSSSVCGVIFAPDPGMFEAPVTTTVIEPTEPREMSPASAPAACLQYKRY